jgi:hypothetical protein
MKLGSVWSPGHITRVDIHTVLGRLVRLERRCHVTADVLKKIDELRSAFRSDKSRIKFQPNQCLKSVSRVPLYLHNRLNFHSF